MINLRRHQLDMRTLRYNAIYSTLGMAIRLGIALATGPLLIRLLGLELYGVWVVLLSVVSVILIAQLGLDTALTQLLAAAYARPDVEDMGHIEGTSLALISVSGAAVAIIQHARSPRGDMRVPVPVRSQPYRRVRPCPPLGSPTTASLPASISRRLEPTIPRWKELAHAT